MHTEPSNELDSESLRKECIDNGVTDDIKGTFSISRAAPGTYATQRGSFEITTEKAIVGVCIWEGSVLELHTVDLYGETKDTQTLRDISMSDAINSIKEHLDKYG